MKIIQKFKTTNSVHFASLKPGDTFTFWGKPDNYYLKITSEDEQNAFNLTTNSITDFGEDAEVILCTSELHIKSVTV